MSTVRDHSAGDTEPAHHAERKTLLGRRGQPEEVARLVQFLYSPKSRYLRGQALYTNEGAFLA
ncbi:SDR family oxidoreductase [Paraburkholderia sp. RL17-337-BIB-A]|uniref:SDR family oxidoreductase n=1 Tax=Paraburkholderia sp. RL17-337-BIB-A TaxID=3031636 RepID=UPI0038B7D7CF